jgi:hypothetical protein
MTPELLRHLISMGHFNYPCSTEVDIEMAERAFGDDWLLRVFEQAERAYQELPEWARPVYVPPAP